MKKPTGFWRCPLILLLLCIVADSASNIRPKPQRQIVFQDPVKDSKTKDAAKVAPPPNWVVKGIDKLTSTLIHDIYEYEGPSFNIILSPVSVWSILVMLLEAAKGTTQEELKNLMGVQPSVPSGDVVRTVRLGYMRLLKLMQSDNYGNASEFSLVNFIVSDRKSPIAQDYESAITEVYKGRNFPVNFSDKKGTAKVINDWAKQATHNRITGVITPGEMNDLKFLIGNAAFFKGRWKYPFNVTLTTLDQFKDENDAIKNEISMMTQRVVLPYGYNTKLESQVVEIPYADDSTSMILILPRRKVKLLDVLSRLKNLPLESITAEMTEDEVELYLPRFTVQSNMYLNRALSQYIPRVFSPAYAELPKLSKDVFVTKVAHKSEIVNVEEGTIASAVTSAQVSYKTTTVRFHANRPFLYLINDRKSRTILFAGTLTNPKVV